VPARPEPVPLCEEMSLYLKKTESIPI